MASGAQRIIMLGNNGLFSLFSPVSSLLLHSLLPNTEVWYATELKLLHNSCTYGTV